MNTRSNEVQKYTCNCMIVCCQSDQTYLFQVYMYVCIYACARIALTHIRISFFSYEICRTSV